MKLLPIRNPKIKLLFLSLMHFATDGLCAYLVFSKLYPDNPKLSLLIFLGYNILAFVTQSPIGIIVDKYNKPKLMIAVSVIAIILGYIFSNVCLLAVFFLGMGNSLFHVAGGKYVTDKSGNNISHLGIFVSTGAVGLVLGQRYFSFTPLIYILFGVLTVCAALMIITDDIENKSYPEEYKSNYSNVMLALLAVIGVVFVRSFVGKVVSADFNLTEYMFLIIAIATALGKAVGGICSKLIGIKATTVVSMGVATACLTLGCGNPITFILGIFTFNFSMPITLYYANILLKGKEGFAFGTLAAFLAPAYFIGMSFTYSPLVRVATALMSLASMVIIILISRRINSHDACTDTHDTP